MQRNRLAGVVLAGVLALTGCAANEITPPGGDGKPAEIVPSPATPLGVAQFGGVVTFPQDIEVSVAPPVVVSASSTANGAIEGKIVTFEIRITNGSDKPLDASIMYPDVTYGSAGHRAVDALDYDENLGVEYFTTLLPDETQTITTAFGIPSEEFDDVRVEILAPTIAGLPAVFRGSVE